MNGEGEEEHHYVSVLLLLYRSAATVRVCDGVTDIRSKL